MNASEAIVALSAIAQSNLAVANMMVQQNDQLANRIFLIVQGGLIKDCQETERPKAKK